MTKTMLAALLGATLLGGTAHAAPAGQDGPPPPPDALLQADTNKDGAISRAEYMAGVDARFAQADANKDGKLSESERQAMRPGGGAGGQGGRGGRLAGRMMDRMDANDDGMISLDEQRAQATRLFDRIDTNKDGKLDQAERDAMRQRMRGMMGRMGRPAGGPDAD